MIRFYISLAAFCGALCISSARANFENVESPHQQMAQMVRMVHPAIGCGSPEQLERLAVILTAQGERAAVSAMESSDCRPLAAFSGPILDKAGGFICVAGGVHSRCLWFEKDAFAPAVY